MKVKELIEKLKEFNPKADIDIIIDNMGYPFEIWYGTSEGVTKQNCESVSFARPDENKENEG